MSNMLRPILGFNRLKHPLLLQPSMKNVVFESNGSDGNYKLVRGDFRLMGYEDKHSPLDKGLNISKIQRKKNDSLDILSRSDENLISDNNNNPAGASLEQYPTGLSEEDRVGLVKELEVVINFRDNNESSFKPQLVSIGPIHRGEPKLKEFEWQKEYYLDDLLHRDSGSTPKKTKLEACLQKVNDLIPQIKESYDGVIKNCSDVDLARMMVMDGCFILEFCFKHNEKILLPNKMQNLRIAMDLILLENQVPFVVLQGLFDCLAPYIGSETLSQVLDKCLAPYIKLFRRSPEKNLILKLFCSLLPKKNSTTDVDSDLPEKISTRDVSNSTPTHVLGYLHKCYHLVAAKSSKLKHTEASKPVDVEQAAKSSNPKDAEELKLVDEKGMEDTYTTFHSIVELDRSGMNFKPHQEDVWSMTIKYRSSILAYLPFFWFKPTLLMPILVIDDTTELILRNFIAYEQSFPQDHYYFTSYVHAMDKLIDSKEDIAKLEGSKVLVNNLGSNQEAADTINKICKNIFFTDFYYTDEFKRMETYYSGIWPNTIAWLRRVYFSNPWSAIALVAAIILFGLTVVQTIFTIMAA
ncbi:hypothetical protein CTI12_AA259460 [Artemisia annua]|uniref:Uncharacterized protein n=1 Tax=Artemisia annua TaxID=35608 RepID=A0A2U1NJK6_ARTAN|nr:hypothetical protein CTI12_AA259460 [Artemisia annua]